MKNFERVRPAVGRPARLGSILLAAGLCGCGLISSAPPEPVRNLEVKDLNGTLLITWENPVSFKRVTVQVSDSQQGSFSPPAFNAAKGPAAAVLSDVVPGRTYKVEVASFASDAPEARRQAETEYRVEKMFIGYADQEDLGRQGLGKEPLDVIFIVHPDGPFAARSGPPGAGQPFDRAEVFQQVTANVLTEVFQRVIKIQDKSDLDALEVYRNYLIENGQKPFWLFDPAALLIVDYREARESGGGGVPGQLYLRILNLKMAREDYQVRERSLFNQRALVAEGYQEVNGKSLEGARTMVLELRDAWRHLLKDVLESPRYVKYKGFLKAGAGENPLTDEMELLFFGKVPEQKEPERAARAKAIEGSLLFGPSLLPSPSPGEAAPRAEKAAGSPGTPPDPARKTGGKSAKPAPAPPPAEKKKAAEPEAKQEKGSP